MNPVKFTQCLVKAELPCKQVLTNMQAYSGYLPRSWIIALIFLTVSWAWDLTSPVAGQRDLGRGIDFVYQSHSELVVLLHRITWKCPHITRLYDIGKSVQGRRMYVLEMSDNPGVHEVGAYIFRQVKGKQTVRNVPSIKTPTVIRHHGLSLSK